MLRPVANEFRAIPKLLEDGHFQAKVLGEHADGPFRFPVLKCPEAAATQPKGINREMPMDTMVHMMPVRTKSLLAPIIAGGLVAGTFDEICAFLSFGRNVPRVVAAGLVGRQAIHSTGAGIWILGVVLHFVVAFGAAAVYCVASRKLHFLREHFVVCGLFYGVAVFITMYLVVMPLSALHAMGPYSYRTLVQAIAVHMVLIGLPIAISLRIMGD